MSLGLMLSVASPAYANFPAPTAGEVLTAYAAAVAVTVFFELLAAFALGVRTRKQLLAIALLNVVTNSVFNLALSTIVPFEPYLLWLLTLEAPVVLVEWFVLLRVLQRSEWSSRRVFTLAVVMNLASLIGGFGLLFLISSVFH